ncbi:MAG TPA: hypothetical protein PK299_01960 [Anaerolineales bacterium]|nr:hypothetical protein [Anaerolineales bacterium]
MKSVAPRSFLDWFSALALLAGLIVLTINVVDYTQARLRMDDGVVIAGVPIGGLTTNEAEKKVLDFYNRPVELYIRDQRILLQPQEITFRPDIEAMFALADDYSAKKNFWLGFWNYIWRSSGRPVHVELQIDYSESQLRQYLTKLASLYTPPSTQPMADSATGQLIPSPTDTLLDIESSLQMVDLALHQTHNRSVYLTLQSGKRAAPTLTSLQEYLNQFAAQRQFNGILSFIVTDLTSGEEIAINRDVGYDGYEMMKLSVHLAALRWLPQPLSEKHANLLAEHLHTSGYTITNALLSEMGDGKVETGADRVTDFLDEVGLRNSFGLTGLGMATERPIKETPANLRTDLTSLPNQPWQTTPSDLSALFAMIYQCAKYDGGALRLLYGNLFTPSICQQILSDLQASKIGALLERSVPTDVLLSHRYVVSPNLIADAGIFFTPQGDFLVVAYLWNKDALDWDTHSAYIEELGGVAYQFFRQAHQPAQP